MTKQTTYIELTSEQFEVLRLALGHWIEENEKTLLDDMEGSPRDERLDQLNYHVSLSLLYKELQDKEQYLWSLKQLVKDVAKSESNENG